jgi:hypothetical protein
VVVNDEEVEQKEPTKQRNPKNKKGQPKLEKVVAIANIRVLFI